MTSKAQNSYKKTLIFGIIFVVLLVLVGNLFGSKESYTTKNIRNTASTTPVFVATHVDTPRSVKGIYMTACVAGTPSWRESLAKLIDNTELNSVVLDIKDYSGTISFYDESLQTATSTKGCRVKDMKDFITELHQKNIYVIGRITVFQDPNYSKLHPELAVKSKSTGGVWHDHKGLAFIDVGAKPYWDYIATLAKTSYNLGFDELNFDYVRYPSDGDMKDTNFTWTVGTSTKPEMLEGFFSYLHNALKDLHVKTSADLFGMTTTAKDDLGIGQELKRALPYFDFIDPMVYPSHYPPTWNGFKNPADHPYEVIKVSMTGGVDKALELASSTPAYSTTTLVAKLRPWLQDFDLGANYGVKEVQDQIRATYNVGLTSWLMWDAGNKYTQGAYLAK